MIGQRIGVLVLLSCLLLLNCVAAQEGYCTKEDPCVIVQSGGRLSERFKLMVTGYYLALLSNRKLIISTATFDPNYMKEKIPGTLQDETHLNQLRAGKIWELHEMHFHTVEMKDTILPQSKPVWRLRGNNAFVDDVIVHQGATKLQDTSAKEAAEKHQLWGDAIKKLFKPSQLIETSIKSLKIENCPDDDCLFVGLRLKVSTMLGSKRTKRDPQSAVDLGISSWAPDGFTFRSGLRQRPVDTEAIPCFVEEVQTLSKTLLTKKGKKKIVVFLTGDTDASLGLVSQQLTAKGIASFTSDTTCQQALPNGLPRHITRMCQYLSFWMLTEMDAIVTNKNGFSESAAKYSCVPSSVFHDLPTSPEHGDFSVCEKHFLSFPDGFCTPEVDIWTMEDYFAHKFPQYTSSSNLPLRFEKYETNPDPALEGQEGKLKWV